MGLTEEDAQGLSKNLITYLIYLDPLHFLNAEGLFRRLSYGQDRILSHRTEFLLTSE